MLSNLGRNLRTLLWSLLLALAVWLAAVTAADPDVVRAYPTPVRVEVIGQDPGLVINGNLPKQVQLTLRAPQSVWDQLTARPDSVRAILDLSGLSAGEHKVDIQIQIGVRPVRIVSTTPSSVTVSMEPLITRTLPLQSTISGQPAIGYQPGQLTVDPKQVVLAGPQSIVESVSRVRVVAKITGIREGFDQTLPIEALDKSNVPVKDLTIQPAAAHVTLPVTRQGGFRDLAVKVVVRGQVASGYRLDSISVTPPVVTVYSSNPDLVNALPGVVETQPLDLQAAKDNVTLPRSAEPAGRRFSRRRTDRGHPGGNLTHPEQSHNIRPARGNYGVARRPGRASLASHAGRNPGWPPARPELAVQAGCARHRGRERHGGRIVSTHSQRPDPGGEHHRGVAAAGDGGSGTDAQDRPHADALICRNQSLRWWEGQTSGRARSSTG